MSYLFPPFLLMLVSLFYLIWRANHGKMTPISKKDADSAALIAVYQQNLAAHPEQKNELDYRLYQELKAQKNRRGAEIGALPLWTYPAMLGVFLAASYFWYQSSGRPFQVWLNLVEPLQPALTRSQYLGDLSPLEKMNPTLYCQALQQRIDHHDRQQLDTLGRCFTAHNDYGSAAEIYTRLHLLYPDDPEVAFNYAQTTVFSHPNKPLAPDVEKILQQHGQTNPVAKILLAASYSQGEKKAEAAKLWAELRQELDPSNPLYNLIPVDKTAEKSTENMAQTAQKPDHGKKSPSAVNNANITVTIAPELLADLSPTARLFVIAAKKGQRMPIAVQALPPSTSQTVPLSDNDSMTGAKLSTEKEITFRAILTATGSVSGEKLAETETVAAPDATLTLHLP